MKYFKMKNKIITTDDRLKLREINDFAKSIGEMPSTQKRQAVLNWCISKDREKKLDDLFDN